MDTSTHNLLQPSAWIPDGYSPPSPPFCPSLPVELWLQIFRWATLPSSLISQHATHYEPFPRPSHSFANGLQDPALRTKLAIVLVCHLWRTLANPFLYEDISMPYHPNALEQSLRAAIPEHTGTTHPATHWVRRVRLPYSSTATVESRPLVPAVELLSQFPSVEVLVRLNIVPASQHSPRFEYTTGCPQLPSLKRLDWASLPEAFRSGGINCLPDVLHAAPHLQYLTLTGELWPHQGLHHAPVTLPHLATIHLQRVNVHLVAEVARWALPRLRSVVTQVRHARGARADMLAPLWRAFGSQLRALALGPNLQFSVADALGDVVARCAGLEEIAYYVSFTHPIGAGVGGAAALATVRWHVQSAPFFSDVPEESLAHWCKHADVLCGPAFPALRRLVVHGDWKAVVFSREAFDLRVAAPLRARGCRVEFAAEE